MLNKAKEKEDARGSTLLHLLSPATSSLKLPRHKDWGQYLGGGANNRKRRRGSGSSVSS